MKVLILAGGFATRLWPLTEKTAKPLVLLAGKPLISWIVEKIPEEFSIIVSTNAVFAEAFSVWKETFFPTRNIEIFVEDSVSEGGKKGALFATSLVISEKKITEDLLLIAGDNYFGFSFSDFLKFYKQAKDTPLIAAYDIQIKEEARSFGVVVPHPEKENCLSSFQEKPEHPLSTLVATGCFLFPSRFFPLLQEFAEKNKDDLGKIFECILEKGEEVRYFRFEEQWFDIGSFSAYLEANKAIIGEKTISGKNVFVSSDAELSGSVFLGDSVKIGANVILENSLVFANSSLKNCIIRDSVVGENVLIEGVDVEYKILRDESMLIR